jgi:hypothetical protein
VVVITGAHDVPFLLAFTEEKVVIPFLEKTWFLWWILATLAILRWFHVFSSRTDDSAIEVPASEEQGSTASDRIPSGTASNLSESSC